MNAPMTKRRWLITRAGPLVTRIRQPNLFAGLTRICMFIGHGRSGSTLVGALLNAHPHIVMSNELDILDYVEQRLSRDQLFHLMYYESLRHARRGSPGGGGYMYAVPNQWQGRHREILVLGDRKAGSTAIQLYRRPELLGRLQERIELPINFVCVVRNPFDTITTSVRKTPRLEDETPEEHLRRQIERYFERWKSISYIADHVGGGDNIFFIRHEALIDDPVTALTGVCRFLDVVPGEDYLRDCSSIIRRNPNKTRSSIEWDHELIDLVRTRAADIPWLRDYEY